MNDPLEQLKSERTSARKAAFEQTRVIVGFKTLFLVLVVLAALGLGIYYAVKLTPVAPSLPAGSPAQKEIQRKIIVLEKEVELLKADLAPEKKPRTLVGLVQTGAEFAISNWVLLSFLAAVGTALYVKWRFKIDYFETYRDLATKKMLAEFYRQLGDRMMIYGEWEAAEAAYRNSLEINPTNIQSTYGIAKASIFQPMKGQKFYAPEIADAKLDHLLKNAGGGPHSQAQLYFLKGVNRHAQGDTEAAKTFLDQAIQIDPTYVGSHLQLGYIRMGDGEIDAAAACFKTALSLDPSYALANNNLGYCHLVTLRFAEAIACFLSSEKAAPSLLTALNLGKAYRFASNKSAAIAWHEAAYSAMGQPGIAKERYCGGDWIYNFMPLKHGDTDTIRRSVRVYAIDQKKAVLLFALGIDHAVNDDFKKADKHIGQAQVLDPTAGYREFFRNEVEATLVFTTLSQAARTWLEQKRNTL